LRAVGIKLSFAVCSHKYLSQVLFINII